MKAMFRLYSKYMRVRHARQKSFSSPGVYQMAGRLSEECAWSRGLAGEVWAYAKPQAASDVF
jgi:hypothetical protein